jgi:hypothetical protein
MVSHINGIIQSEGVQEWGAEKCVSVWDDGSKSWPSGILFLTK